jgi:NAD(P)-dependent dehydrogenase (short-subunit alcohol dehydrogenase family)
MDLRLDGCRAIVTGGSRGIGLETVRALLAEGASVVTGSRGVTPELAATAATPVTVDLSTAEGATELVGAAVEELGGIDLLVNNVGIGDTEGAIQGITKDLLSLPEERWHETFDLNFYSALRVTRAALPSLIENRGTVINLSTSSAHSGGKGAFHYRVAKAALRALTKVVAEQYGASGVRALTVAPGPVATGVWTDPDGMMGTLARERDLPLEEFSKMTIEGAGASTGRITTPEEVARLIVFLASPSNMTGSEHIIDGGIVKSI